MHDNAILKRHFSLNLLLLRCVHGQTASSLGGRGRVPLMVDVEGYRSVIHSRWLHWHCCCCYS